MYRGQNTSHIVQQSTILGLHLGEEAGIQPSEGWQSWGQSNVEGSFSIGDRRHVRDVSGPIMLN